VIRARPSSLRGVVERQAMGNAQCCRRVFFQTAEKKSMDLKEIELDDLMALGREQTRDLTFYKLVFTAFERLTWENSSSTEVYRNSLLAMVSGFLASVKPEYLPQALAAKNLLMKKVSF